MLFPVSLGDGQRGELSIYHIEKALKFFKYKDFTAIFINFTQKYKVAVKFSLFVCHYVTLPLSVHRM